MDDFLDSLPYNNNVWVYLKERDLPKSIGCSKNFRGPEMLDTREKVETW